QGLQLGRADAVDVRRGHAPRALDVERHAASRRQNSTAGDRPLLPLSLALPAGLHWEARPSHPVPAASAMTMLAVSWTAPGSGGLTTCGSDLAGQLRDWSRAPLVTQRLDLPGHVLLCRFRHRAARVVERP